MIDIEKLKAEALEALDNLDDYARMEIGIEPIGAVNHLTNFINTMCERLQAAERDAAIFNYYFDALFDTQYDWPDCFANAQSKDELLSNVEAAMKESEEMNQELEAGYEFTKAQIAELEALRFEVVEQSAVIEKLRAVLENCRPVMESYSGTTRFNEFIAALAIPTDSKQVLHEWLDKVLGDPILMMNSVGNTEPVFKTLPRSSGFDVPLFKKPEIK